MTIGGFYKYFVDPIEQTYREAGSGLQYTYHNADHAKAFGVEVDIKKHLDFIGLKDLSFVFNGAYIHSKVYFPEGSFERDRAMQGQSPYLINTGLFYQNDAKGLSASVFTTGSASVSKQWVYRHKIRTTISPISTKCPVTHWT